MTSACGRLSLGGVLCGVALACAAQALAWGPEGHRIVCEIAWQEAGAGGRQLVSEMMAGDVEDTSFAEACNWADRLKSDPRFDWVKPLHYVNIPPGQSFDAETDCRAEGCAARAIGQTARVLADTSMEKPVRREALKYLTHFVGDLHQPLHVSYARDAGGNAITTQLCASHSPSSCQEMKLHGVWDSGIIDAAGVPWRTMARELQEKVTDEQRERWRPLDVEAITAETFALAESRAYHTVKDGVVQDGYIGKLPEPVTLDPSYAATMSPVVREQLQKAGVRLAAVLDALAAGQVPPGLTKVGPLHAMPAAAVNHALHVRAQPRTSSPKVATLAPGEKIEVLGEVVVEHAPHWYVVRLADGRAAFVRADYADVAQ